ncbi:MAG: FliA/WhiG family RNA polymerase sigma factor [Candidimonas sp.]|nr:MAG: FliA/WhiG family RNA polymerase sigma factor [Candidimonas sp.]
MLKEPVFPSERPRVEDLVKQFTRLVRHEAVYLASRLPRNVSLDDLIQAGMLGLFESAKRYVATPSTTSFDAYAIVRIRGAMMDELRHEDWMPRALRRKVKQLEGAISVIEARTGRAATVTQITRELGVSMRQYEQTLSGLTGLHLFYAEDIAPKGSEDDAYGAATGADPAEVLEKTKIRAVLAKAIDKLPERERTVLALYYEEGLNNKEIGAVLHLTESRISQIRTHAVLRLRADLGHISWSEVSALAQE